MLFHNKYTISIGRMAILLESQDYKLIKRKNIPVPKKVLIRAYNRLIKEFNEVVNKSSINRAVESGILRLSIYNKAYNLYPLLILICQTTWDEKHLKMVEDITGYKLEKLEDREMLVNEMNRLKDKYHELLVEEKKEGVSFVQVIISTEMILEEPISREIKLFEFEHYMKSASDKVAQLEKMYSK